ncbi:hypothetical protein D3C71_1052630 [compost metagenome]
MSNDGRCESASQGLRTSVRRKSSPPTYVVFASRSTLLDSRGRRRRRRHDRAVCAIDHQLGQRWKCRDAQCGYVNPSSCSPWLCRWPTFPSTRRRLARTAESSAFLVKEKPSPRSPERATWMPTRFGKSLKRRTAKPNRHPAAKGAPSSREKLHRVPASALERHLQLAAAGDQSPRTIGSQTRHAEAAMRCLACARKCVQPAAMPGKESVARQPLRHEAVRHATRLLARSSSNAFCLARDAHDSPGSC